MATLCNQDAAHDHLDLDVGAVGRRSYLCTTDAYLCVKEHTTFEEEALVCLVVHGNSRPIEEVQAELKHEQAQAAHGEGSSAKA